MPFDSTEISTLEIPCNVLHVMLVGVAPVASRDGMRHHMTMVQIRWTDREVTATATDGHRLHRTTAQRLHGTGSGAVYLTRDAAIALAKAAKAAQKAIAGPMAIVGPTEIRYPGGPVACTAVDPGFPPCDRVIPAYEDRVPEEPRSDGPMVARRGTGRVSVDPSYMIDAMRILPGAEGVELRLGATDLDPIRVDAHDLDTGVRGVAVVMTRRR